MHSSSSYIHVVETDTSDIGYGGILKQKFQQSSHEQLVRFHSGVWLGPQKSYSTIKKEILSIVQCISKFQDDLLNKKFLLRIDCQSAKFILEKDVQNIASKQIFARWQAIPSIFNSNIEYLQGSNNSLPNFLTREFFNHRFKMSTDKGKSPIQKTVNSKDYEIKASPHSYSPIQSPDSDSEDEFQQFLQFQKFKKMQKQLNRSRANSTASSTSTDPIGGQDPFNM